MSEDDAIAQCHAILDRFDVPDAEGLPHARLHARMEAITAIKSRKPHKVLEAAGLLAEQIDAAPKDLSTWSVYGMEMRGLIGDIVNDVEITRCDDGHYDTRIAFTASCVVTGIRRQVIFDGQCQVPELCETTAGTPCTPEQTIIKLVLYRMLVHELAECLRVDGVPLCYTHPQQPPDLSRKELRIDGNARIVPEPNEEP